MIWGLVIGAATVVAIAGVVKLAKPAVTAQAIRTAGVTVPDPVVSGLGLVELLLGVVVIVWHPTWAVLVLGAFYIGFALVSIRLLVVRGPTVPCGCFGQSDAPIGIEHVVVNLVVAAVVFDAAAGIGTATVDPVAAVGATSLLLVLLAVVPGLRATRR